MTQADGRPTAEEMLDCVRHAAAGAAQAAELQGRHRRRDGHRCGDCASAGGGAGRRAGAHDAPGSKHDKRWQDRVIDVVDEVELIDMSPHALRQRMKHGNIYAPERADRALDSFFRDGNLIALRDMANRYRTELLACSLKRRVGLGWAGALEDNTRFAEDLGAETICVPGKDVARALMQVAREKNVGSVIIGHSRHARLHEMLRRPVVQSVLRLAADVDVRVVAEREGRQH